MGEHEVDANLMENKKEGMKPENPMMVDLVSFLAQSLYKCIFQLCLRDLSLEPSYSLIFIVRK